MHGKQWLKNVTQTKTGLIFLIACSPFFVHAQGFQVNLEGQKQQAMGGAGAALIQDGTALYYNPGGVAFLKQNSLSLGITGVDFKGTFTDEASSAISETKSPVSFPFTGYFVGGKKDSKLKYGLAAYTPFGSVVKWQEGWTGRFVLTSTKLFLVYVQPTVSYKITDQLGVGAGFVYATGKVELQRDLPVTGLTGTYGNAMLEGSTTGYGFNAGVYFEPLKTLSFGITYHSAVDMKLKKGTATFNVPASVATNFPSGNFTSSLSLPDIITLGVAFSPCKKLNVAFDANYIGWKSFDSLKFDFEKTSAVLTDIGSPRQYKNTSSYRIGAQYAVSAKVDARAGINYLITPVKDGFVTPEVPDATRLNFTVGLGYKFSKRFGADASFSFERLKRTGTNKENLISGTYKSYIYLPGLSLTYNL